MIQVDKELQDSDTVFCLNAAQNIDTYTILPKISLLLVSVTFTWFHMFDIDAVERIYQYNVNVSAILITHLTVLVKFMSTRCP